VFHDKNHVISEGIFIPDASFGASM